VVRLGQDGQGCSAAVDHPPGEGDRIVRALAVGRGRGGLDFGDDRHPAVGRGGVDGRRQRARVDRETVAVHGSVPGGPQDRGHRRREVVWIVHY